MPLYWKQKHLINQQLAQTILKLLMLKSNIEFHLGFCRPLWLITEEYYLTLVWEQNVAIFCAAFMMLKEQIMNNLPNISNQPPIINSATDAAKLYSAFKWKLLPITYKTKACHIKGWQNLIIKEEDIENEFVEPCNIGVLLGSSNLTDVDVDSPAALPFLKWLPPTNAIWGRPSNPNSHYLYSGENKSRSFSNSSGVVIEIRSKGCYAVMPPSTHPDDEIYTWESYGEPSAGIGLEEACTKIFIAATLLTYWQEGVRHSLALGISGLLLKAGWTPDEVMDLVVTVAKATGDNNIFDRQTAVSTTASLLKSGESVAGYSNLVDILGKQDADAINKLANEKKLSTKVDLSIIDLVSKAKTSKDKLNIAIIVCNDLRKRGRFLRVMHTEELMFFNNYELELYRLGSIEFRALCGELYKINGKDPVWAFIEEHLKQFCIRQGEPTELFRFARYQAGKLYIHAGRQRVFCLDGININEIDNGDDGVLFYRDQTLTPIQPNFNFIGSPVRDTLVNAANATDLGRLDLYHISIYGLYFESILPTKPIVLFTGPKGSGKTSAGRALKRALHGPTSNVDSGLTSKEDAFWASVCNNSLVCIDNVDSLVSWFADAIAVVSTGSTFKRRKLYETNVLVEYVPRCFVIVTSRNPESFTRDDIVDRLLLVEVKRRDKFIDESSLLSNIDELRNDIWGELLTYLNKIVAALNEPRDPAPLPYRMADWARFAIKCAPILGIHDIHGKLNAMETSKIEFALDESPLVQALDEWLAINPQHDFIATGDLFKAIQKIYEIKGDKFCIKDSRAFGTQLKNMRSELESRYQIEDKLGSGNRRFYRFRLIADGAM